MVEKLSKDVFLNIDGQTSESIEIISERLEMRSLKGQFASFTKNYFSLLKIDEQASVLELGGGTGVIGRSFIKEKKFTGKYTVSDLSKKLLEYGEKKSKQFKLDHLMEFKLIDAMKPNFNKTELYDAVIMHTLVSHVPNPEIVLRNAHSFAKKGCKIVIFDADYETLFIQSGEKKLDKIVNNAIKKGCVAQPKVMREIPIIARKLGLKLLNYKPHLLFEVGNSDFFIGMGQALSSAIVKDNQLNKKIADSWIKKIKSSISDETFFGMCPYMTYIYEVLDLET